MIEGVTIALMLVFSYGNYTIANHKHKNILVTFYQTDRDSGENLKKYLLLKQIKVTLQLTLTCGYLY